MAGLKLGLIREGKLPQDNRVAFTPAQCKWLLSNYPGLDILIQSSQNRCFTDQEYIRAGLKVTEYLSGCDILFGIKEVPVADLIPGKTYLFFSHTRKKQIYNQQ